MDQDKKDIENYKISKQADLNNEKEKIEKS